uniref:CID domain-containing protein n=1 Tax=Arundo donax TaxID=35708 RepID=A0A0A8Y915_ARUDO
MSAGFNKEILAQKLAKLNSSQQSIETLSHWCVFHHRCCRQVVETWDCEFFSAPCERRVSLLYLANDIMQNSRKEGSGYITEFMRVIPAALSEVFTNGDDFGRNVVKRLIDIWEDRRIFDIQGRSLKDDFFRRLKDLRNKLKKPGGELLEKIVSSYKHMLNAPIDEDTLMQKCQGALSIVDNLNKAYGNNYLGSSNGSGFVEELQEQRSILRNSIEQLKTSESLRASLISILKEALNEQELKMEQVRSHLQAAQYRYKKANDLCQDLGIDEERHQPSNQGLKKSSLSEMHDTGATRSANAGSLQKGQSSAVMYSQGGDGGERSATAANIVTKFAAGAASEETLNGVLSSRANGGNILRKIEEHSPVNKRQKLVDDTHISEPQSQPQPPPLPPPPPFPHPDTFQPPPPPEYPPSPEPSPPPTPTPPQTIPPPPPTSVPPQIISPVPPIAGAFLPFPVGPPGPVTGMPFGIFPPYTPMANFPMTSMPPGFPGAPNPPPAFQGLGGTFYGPPPYPTAPPSDRK